METVEEVLAHYGVRGMRWGVRKNRVDTSSDDAKNADQAKKKVKAGGVKALSNKELQSLVTRMNLEQQFSRLHQPSPASKVGKFVADTLLNVGKQEAAKFLAAQAAKKVAKALAGLG